MDHTSPPLTLRLSDLPLWRLIVALDDAERTVGPDSSTARAVSRAIREKLRQEPPPPKPPTHLPKGPAINSQRRVCRVRRYSFTGHARCNTGNEPRPSRNRRAPGRRAGRDSEQIVAETPPYENHPVCEAYPE